MKNIFLICFFRIMPKILKKNTAILQVPEKVINDKNKLINSTTNKGDLKKDTIKIQTGKTLKVVSKGTSIEQQKETKPKVKKETKPKPVKETKPKPVKETKQKEPEIYYRRYGEEFPIIIKPLTENELNKDFFHFMYGNISSVEKFNKLKIKNKLDIEFSVNDNNNILDKGAKDLVNNNYSGSFDDSKFDRAVDKYTAKFYKIATKLRKKSKIEFLKFINNAYVNIEQYRFIF